MRASGWCPRRFVQPLTFDPVIAQGDPQMISRYREVVFGVVIGLVAGVIEVIMYAREQGRTVVEEFMDPEIEMFYYRLLLLAFVFALVLILWKKNQHERETRHVA